MVVAITVILISMAGYGKVWQGMGGIWQSSGSHQGSIRSQPRLRQCIDAYFPALTFPIRFSNTVDGTSGLSILLPFDIISTDNISFPLEKEELMSQGASVQGSYCEN